MLDPENATYLKPWLIKTLEPICDAEPGALADYILALLKHAAPEPELRKELVSQLEEFLEKECTPFIDTLFNVLRSKSYMPYAPPSPPSNTAASSSSHPIDGGIPIPLDGLLNPSNSSSGHTRKRSFDQDDDLRPTKTSRLNADGQFSRYGRPESGRGTWQPRGGERGGRMNIPGRADFMDGGMNGAVEGMNGRGAYRQPERRGICRDYHNNGYCARGAFCKYSHGDDAVIPAQLFPMNGAMPTGPLPFVPIMPNGAMPQFAMGAASTAPYDPRERMDMRPMQGNRMNGGPSRPGMGIGPAGPQQGSHIQDLTPQIPPDERMQQEEPGAEGYSRSMNGAQAMGSGDMEIGEIPMSSDRGGGFRGGRGGGSGGGSGPRGYASRGTFGPEVQSFRPERRNDKTLVVEKIPEDKLSLGSVNEWFSKFGTVTNVAVDTGNAKALVSFSNHEEALKAWKSEDAVFGNRFVKVFWHRPMEGHGQKGARLLAASASVVANITGKESSPSPAAGAPSEQAVPAAPQLKKTPSAASTALAAKQQLLEQQIAEQKSLMSNLVNATAEEKKEIMARLRKLNEEMKAPSSSTNSTPAPSKTSRGSTPKAEDKEQKERERLDKELEMRHTASAAEGTAESEESTEDLKAKLAKLKAEAASLGLDTTLESQYTPSSTYRPYRGRGRGGRSSFYSRGAMRGGPPRASMKLDNRPKKLLVKGASTDQVQAVRDWYETTQQVDTVEPTDSGDILVAFKSRAAAEQGLAKGSHITTVGNVNITWYTGHARPNGVSTPTTSSAPTPATVPKLSPPPFSAAPVPEEKVSIPLGLGEEDHDETMHHEEEPVTAAWDDAEDGFGMM